MFRGTGNSEMNDKHVGIGTLLESDPNCYLVLIADGDKCVNVLSLSSFYIIGKRTVVEDIHHLSEDELRSVLSPIGYTLSDYSIYPKGLKHTSFKQYKM